MITTFELYETKSTSVKINLKDLMLSVVDRIEPNRILLEKMLKEMLIGKYIKISTVWQGDRRGTVSNVNLKFGAGVITYVVFEFSDIRKIISGKTIFEIYVSTPISIRLLDLPSVNKVIKDTKARKQGEVFDL